MPVTVDAPVLTSRDLNVAALSTRALLDTLLVDAGISFETSVVLGQAFAAPDGLPMAAVLERFTVDVRRPADAVPGIVAEARDAGVVVGDDVLHATEAGRALQQSLNEQVADIVSRVYAGIAHDDLVVARRVVDQVTAQARAELARLSAA